MEIKYPQKTVITPMNLDLSSTFVSASTIHRESIESKSIEC